MGHLGAAVRRLGRALGRRPAARSPGPSDPILVCTHHKTGTVLFANVFGDVARAFGWEADARLRWSDAPLSAEITHFQTSSIGPTVLAGRLRGVHVIRDPRAVVLSGFGYHRRCSEAWCTNTDFDPTPPITFPRVPYSQEWRPEEWKRAYLEALDGRSYQAHLQALDRDDGLAFEMAHYAWWTTEAMLAWDRSDPRFVEVRMEDIAADYDGQWARIFAHLGFDDAQQARAVALAARHDLGRMDSADRSALAHVSSDGSGDWRDRFGPAQWATYTARFGDAHRRLGYPD